MSTIEARFPASILAQVQHEVNDLKEDFLSLIYDINRNEKPIWTILKEMKDAIPAFIDAHILTVLAQKYDVNRIKELKRKMPKKSLMNCRQLLNNLISAIEQENLLQEYLKNLVMIINNTNSSGQEFTYQRHSKNWRNAIKIKLLALMLLVYQFSLEKEKNIFNIVDLWYKIYPETPIWQLKDERFSITQQKQDQNESSHNNDIQNDSHTNLHANKKNSKEHGKTLKSSRKNCIQDDLISYELELLEIEFNRNLHISDHSKEDKQRKNKIDMSKRNGGCNLENESCNNGMPQMYQDEESTTQEEEEEEEDDDSSTYPYPSPSQKRVQQSGSKKQHRHIQPNFVKKTRKNRLEGFSAVKQITDLSSQLERINIEPEDQLISTLSKFQQLRFEEGTNKQQHHHQNEQGIQHSFSFEINSHNTSQLPHFQSTSSQSMPLNDTTHLHAIKNNLSNLYGTSPSIAQLTSSVQHNNQFSQPNFNFQQNENNPVSSSATYQDCSQNQNGNKNISSLSSPSPSSELPQHVQMKAIPILRNPCHQVFEVPLKDNTCINYFISSQ